MDGIWWEVLISLKNAPASRNRSRGETKNTHTNPNTKSKRNSIREVDESSNVDHVVTNAKPSHFEAQLFHFWRQWAMFIQAAFFCTCRFSHVLWLCDRLWFCGDCVLCIHCVCGSEAVWLFWEIVQTTWKWKTTEFNKPTSGLIGTRPGRIKEPCRPRRW